MKDGLEPLRSSGQRYQALSIPVAEVFLDRRIEFTDEGSSEFGQYLPDLLVITSDDIPPVCAPHEPVGMCLDHGPVQSNGLIQQPVPFSPHI